MGLYRKKKENDSQTKLSGLFLSSREEQNDQDARPEDLRRSEGGRKKGPKPSHGIKERGDVLSRKT